MFKRSQVKIQKKEVSVQYNKPNIQTKEVGVQSI
jgi:hypothetical protein